MNRTQQRLHEYRRREAVRGISAPALARGATVRAGGDRVVWRVDQPDFAAEISMPRRPRGWILGGAEAPEADGYATVRVAAGTADAIVAARAWLASLPEARGLPAAIAGGAEALVAAAALGPAADALILDHDAAGAPVLIPTLVTPDKPGASIEEFLDAEVEARDASSLNHRHRRLLARRLARGMRADVRGLRAAIATLASALALTISMGLFAAPAEATFTASYNTLGGLLTISDPAGNNNSGVTLGCGVGVPAGKVSFDDGSGATTVAGQAGGVDCASTAGITVDAQGGADTVDLGAVDTADYVNLGVGAGNPGVSILGAAGGDTIAAVNDFASTVSGGTGIDSVDASTSADFILGGSSGDDLDGRAGSDTLSFTDLSTGVGVNANLFGGTAVSGAESDTISSFENAIGTNLADTLISSLSVASLDGANGADSVQGSASGDTIVGGVGDDILDGANGADTIDAGSENDSVLGGGGSGVDTVGGFAGNDTIDAGAGGDFVFAGNDDDQLISSDTANDTLNGEAGNDTADFSLATGPVTVNLQADSATGSGTDTLTSIEGALGSPAADSMTGDTLTAQSNTLVGNGSGDTLTGQQGADSLSGAGGTDSIFGGGNNDSLDGGAGNDTLSPSTASAGELLTGGTEDDLLLAPSFGSTLSGNDGQDTITGSGQADTIDAGAGPDTVDAAAGADTIDGAAGNDTLLGNQDNDSILGGTENDTIDGRLGADTISGDGGNDTLRPSASADSVLGAGGTDRVVQDQPVTNPSITNTLLGGEGPDTLDGQVENASIIGDGVLDASAFTLGSVTIEAASGPSTLRPGIGSDSLIASGSNDRIEQTADANQTLTDTLLTGAGSDTLSGSFRVSLTGGAGANNLNASAYTGLNVTLDGQGANDTLAAGLNGSANDSLVGGAGAADRIVVSRNISMTLTDTLFTGAGDSDTLSSIEQASLAGGTGFNDLDASAFSGNTTIDGSDGGDTIAGAAGGDSLVGGIGVDRIEQTTDAATQLIADGAATGDGNDSLSGFESASISGGAGNNAISAAGFTGTNGATIVGLAGTDTITGSTADDSLDGGANADRMINTADTNQVLTDTLLTSGLNQDTLTAFEGASLTGGAAGNVLNALAFTGGGVTLDGQGGDDVLRGTAASDSLIGGPHAAGDLTDQTANANQTLTDTQLTGVGTDTITGLERVGLNGGAGANDLDASGFSGQVTIFGDAGNDTLAGAAGSDQLQGGNDTDRLEQTSDAGSQTLNNTTATGDGTDQLFDIEQASMTGGAAANSIVGSSFTGGPMTLTGLGGNDTLTAAGGADSVDGGANDDSLNAGAANDTLSGGGGGDVIDGSTGTSDRLVEIADASMTLADNALSGNGNDTLAGPIETASLTGGAGANAISAASFTLGPVSLDGQAGADSLIGSAQGDSLAGSTENDVLRGGAGTDTMDGGAGSNTADYSDDPGGAAIQANLGTGQITGAQAETLANLQNLVGTSFGDALTGSGSANTLAGGPGPDTVTGGGGSDALQGNAGNDVHNSQDGGIADTNDCGADVDTANADVQDTTANCETVANPDAGQPGGPPVPPPPPAADTKAPDLGLSGKTKQKDKTQVKVTVSCDEACTVEATGTIKIPEIKGKGGGKRAKSKKFDLKRASASLTAGQSQTLKLKLSGKAKKALKKAIKEKKSTAKVTATATDPAGNAATSPTLKVKVKK